MNTITAAERELIVTGAAVIIEQRDNLRASIERIRSDRDNFFAKAQDAAAELHEAKRALDAERARLTEEVGDLRAQLEQTKAYHENVTSELKARIDSGRAAHNEDRAARDDLARRNQAQAETIAALRADLDQRDALARTLGSTQAALAAAMKERDEANNAQVAVLGPYAKMSLAESAEFITRKLESRMGKTAPRKHTIETILVELVDHAAANVNVGEKVIATNVETTINVYVLADMVFAWLGERLNTGTITAPDLAAALREHLPKHLV